jgi:type I restriction enzyme S subunit
MAGEVSLGRQRAPKYHKGPNMRPYLRVANVFEDRIDTNDIMEMQFGDSEFEQYRLQPGDIVLNEGQSPALLGRPALYRGVPENVAFTNSLIRFRPHADVLPEWALFVFRRHLHAGRFAREARITTNIAHLSVGRFKKVEFVIPPLDEQERRVKLLAAILSGITASESSMATMKRRASRLRSAVLEVAVGGRLVPELGASSEHPQSEELEFGFMA